jgi:hypothetical protein
LKLSHTLLFLTLLSPFARADSPDDQNPVVERYIEAQEEQREKMRGVQMQVRMVGSIPNLAKTGSMEALRAISKFGKVTYDALRFEGDGTVKNHVLVRYLTAEAENFDSPNPRLAINKENYKFKNKGLQLKEGEQVYVLELNPRRKEVGLFKGEVWLDPETMLPVREAGRFVKSPSVFIRKVEFVRNYEIREGVAVPTSMKSFAETRIVGRTELNIDYVDFIREPESPAWTEETACPATSRQYELTGADGIG